MLMRKLIGFIAQCNEDFCCRRIEKALGFDLQPWQIDYIFDRLENVPNTGRGTGKSLAVIIKACMDYTAKDLKLRKGDARTLRRLIQDDPDVQIIRPVYIYTEMKAIYEKLNKVAKIKLRNITFVN